MDYALLLNELTFVFFETKKANSYELALILDNKGFVLFSNTQEKVNS